MNTFDDNYIRYNAEQDLHRLLVRLALCSTSQQCTNLVPNDLLLSIQKGYVIRHIPTPNEDIHRAFEVLEELGFPVSTDGKEDTCELKASMSRIIAEKLNCTELSINYAIQTLLETVESAGYFFKIKPP